MRVDFIRIIFIVIKPWEAAEAWTEDRRYDAGVDFVKELALLKQECHTIFGKHFQILEGFLWEVVFIL